MKRPLSAFAGLVFASGTLVSQASAEVIEEVLAHAYNTNPTLMARRASLRSTDESVPQAKAGWRPTVSVTAQGGPQFVESNTSTPYYQKRIGRTFQLSATQPIYRGGRTEAAIDQAENTVMAGRATLAASEQTVLLQSATAYMDVVRDESVVALNINNVQVLRRQLEAAQERFRVGEITRTDVSQAEARVARAIADRVQAEANLRQSRASFVNAVGVPPERPVPPRMVLTLPGTFEEATGLAADNNPNVLAAVYTEKASVNGVDLVRGELLPTVSLAGEITRAIHTSTLESESRTKEVRASVSVPIYEAGAVYARLRAQKHTAGQRQIEIVQSKRDAIETATQAWEQLQAARARLQSYNTQIGASEAALRGVEEEARVGSRTLLDVLDAEQELFDARVNVVRAERDQVVFAFQLKAAVGQLNARDLNLQVDYYDPTDHYEKVRNKWIGSDIDTDSRVQ
jgi:outer membrane protein